VLGGRHSGHVTNRPTFAGEPRRKCPRNRAGSLARWVFGESQVLLRRAIVAVSLVMGRVGSGRRDFGCWVARVSAGALQPESDSRVSVVFATCRSRGLAPQGATRWFALSGRDMSRAPCASFLEVSPRSRGKDEPRQGQRPAKGARLRSNVPSRSVQVSRYWLAISERRGRKLTTAPVSAPPGKGCHWPAEWVTVRFVHAFLIVKTDSRGVHRDAPSGELRQRRSELGGQSAPKGNDRSSAEGEERFGARWNGLVNESLAAPPVRHHGPGAANADRGCSQHPSLQPVHQPSSQK